MNNIVGSDVIASGAASAQSAVIPAHIHKVMLSVTADAWFAYGTNPTAAADTDGSVFLPYGTTVCVGVVPGQKFAVIQDAAAGHLSIAYLS